MLLSYVLTVIIITCLLAQCMALLSVKKFPHPRRPSSKFLLNVQKPKTNKEVISYREETMRIQAWARIFISVICFTPIFYQLKVIDGKFDKLDASLDKYMSSFDAGMDRVGASLDRYISSFDASLDRLESNMNTHFDQLNLKFDENLIEMRAMRIKADQKLDELYD